MDTSRYCADIGMFAIDRSIPESCVHRTDYCDANCYNVKLYAVYRSMHTKDVRNEQAWAGNTAEDWRAIFDRKRLDTSRIRLMTRGEAFSDYSDIERVRDLANAMPDRLIWVPTRAWRHPLLAAMVQQLASECPNLRIQASLDPSNTAEEWDMVMANGWPIIFFGDDTMAEQKTFGSYKVSKCPKTWGKVKGACRSCKNRCFSGSWDTKIVTHLQEH